jgi:sulfoxide reductase catalytic subunit YedY
MARIRSSEITPKHVYLNRRAFMKTSALGTVGTAVAGAAAVGATVTWPAIVGAQGGLRKLEGVRKSPLSTTEAQNAYEHVTGFNNFYEFASGAGDGPKKLSGRFRPSPWKIAVEGAVAKPASYALEDFIKPHVLEERIYRFRCVEAWSLVIPWIGIPLADVIKRVEPASNARFVEFYTLHDIGQFPQQRTDVLEWPYVEGLRLDEAMHPLTILAVGLYGEVLPNQNGAPIRLVVPWKYGFKSIKSIVKMRFVERQPINTWQREYPQAYGFYANVNPAVDHPNWSQAREARLPSLFKTTRTLPFNGYADQVQHLYAGMDLRRNY